MPSKKAPKRSDLSRRERQIMDAVYRLGRASAVEIRDAMAEPPSTTAVRTLLGILHDKGHVRVEVDGPRNMYEPVVPHDEMAQSVIDNVLATFFNGSVERVVATLLSREESRLSPEELERLAGLVEEARRKGQ